MKNYTVVKDWTTAAGLRAVITRGGALNHLCGYVGLPHEHMLFGVGYAEENAALTKILQTALSGTIGKRSPLALMGGAKATMEVVFNIHGSITYSDSGRGEYPVAADLWWVGFDCAHADDTPDKCNEEYVTKECENLAEQLRSIVDKFKEIDR